MYQQNSKSTIDGRTTEDLFQKSAANHYWNAIKADTQDDKYNGIDFYIRAGALNHSVQVKGPRRVGRNDQEYSTEFTWLELKNVAGGSGSLLKETTFTALYMPWVKKFILFPTKELREYVIAHINYNKAPLTNKHGIVEWDRYTRSNYGKSDEIVLISYNSLREFYTIYLEEYDPSLLIFDV